jgi:hypothetical protein
VQTDALALSALRVRYLHPYDEYARGGPGTYVLDVRIERIERSADGFRVLTQGTTWDGRLEFDVDDVIAATGFQTPLRDLPQLGLVTVSDGRIPALTPFWESVSLPGCHFAGNASQGAKGVGKRGAGASSTSVNGFRYNARVLAQHLAGTLNGHAPARPPVSDLVAFLLAPSSAPELWVQKGYLCRVVAAGRRLRDEDVVPLATSSTRAAPMPSPPAWRSMMPAGSSRWSTSAGAEVAEHLLEPHPLHEYTSRPIAVSSRSCSPRFSAVRKASAPAAFGRSRRRGRMWVVLVALGERRVRSRDRADPRVARRRCKEAPRPTR